MFFNLMSQLIYIKLLYLMIQKKKLFFYIVENTFVDVEELNDVLRTNEYTQVDEGDDSNEINIKDCDEDNDDEIKEEEDNSD